MKRTPLRRKALRPKTTRTTRQRTLTSLRKEADRLFSRYIRHRDGVCQARDEDRPCGGVLQCAHLISRRPGYLATRYDHDNAVALCAAHHKWFTERPLEWWDWCENRLGPVRWEELRDRAKASKGRPDYQPIIDDLTERLDDRWDA